MRLTFRHRALGGGALALTLAAAVLFGSETQANAGTPSSVPSPARAVFVSVVGGDSFEASVLKRARVDAAFRKQAASWLPHWLATAGGNGNSWKEPLGTANGQEQVARLVKLESQLDSPLAMAPSSSPQTTVSPAATPLSGPISIPPAAPAVQAPPTGMPRGDGLKGPQSVFSPAIDITDPNTFPVIGEKAGPNTYWHNIILVATGYSCTNSCVVTDRMTTHVTVDPGAVTSKYSVHNYYFPDGQNYKYPHFEFYAIGSSAVVGNAYTGIVIKDSSFFAKSSHSLAGVVLTNAVAFYVYSFPEGIDITDGGKTADSSCQSDNRCFY